MANDTLLSEPRHPGDSGREPSKQLRTPRVLRRKRIKRVPRLTVTQMIAQHAADLQSHAKTITVFNDEIAGLKSLVATLQTDKEVRAVRDAVIVDRMERIETSIIGVQQALDKQMEPWTSGFRLIAGGVAICFVNAIMLWVFAGGLRPPI